MKSKLLTGLLSLLVLLAVPTLVLAETVTIKYIGLGANDVAQIWGGGHSGTVVQDGLHKFEDEEGLEYIGFCIDLPQPVSDVLQTYEISGLVGSPITESPFNGIITETQAIYISELVSLYFDSSWVTPPFDIGENAGALAFSLALLEVIYEKVPLQPSLYDVTVDGTSGPLGFYNISNSSSIANNWLHSLTGIEAVASLTVLRHSDYQDVLSIPEPVTILLFGIGFLIFLFGRRRRWN